jgi:hypothetical protein
MSDEDEGVLTLLMPVGEKGEGPDRPCIEDRLVIVALARYPPTLFVNAGIQPHSRPLVQDILAAHSGVFAQSARFAKVWVDMSRQAKRPGEGRRSLQGTPMRADIESDGSQVGCQEFPGGHRRLLSSQRGERGIGVRGNVLIGIVRRLSMPDDINLHWAFFQELSRFPHLLARFLRFERTCIPSGAQNPGKVYIFCCIWLQTKDGFVQTWLVGVHNGKPHQDVPQGRG